MRLASITSRLAGLGGEKWALHVEARRRAAAGSPIIELTIGEPDTPPPPPVIEAAITSLRAGNTRYTGGRGLRSVVDAIARKYSRRTGRTIGPGNILYFPGTQTALYVVMTGLVEAGDDVLVGDPLYATYEGVIRSTGARVVPVPLDPAQGFHLTIAALERSITDRSRVLLLNSPHNPTGATLSSTEIEAIVGFCERHDLWIVSDEVYESMAYGAAFASPFDVPAGAGRTIVVSSISKSHMLPGFRSGWCVGPEAFIEALLPVSETMLFGAQPFLQDAAAHAIDNEFEECRFMVETFRARAAAVTEALANVPGISCAAPEGGMFAMVDVRGTGLDGDGFAWRLLDEEKVAVMPGSSFGAGAGGHIRISLSRDVAELREACARVARLAIRLTRETPS
ncbi:MAG: pyridoxal phosphate-dependent aminotransferase [Labrys sp. (in: a-proteobacteria)]